MTIYFQIKHDARSMNVTSTSLTRGTILYQGELTPSDMQEFNI